MYLTVGINLSKEREQSTACILNECGQNKIPVNSALTDEQCLRIETNRRAAKEKLA